MKIDLLKIDQLIENWLIYWKLIDWLSIDWFIENWLIDWLIENWLIENWLIDWLKIDWLVDNVQSWECTQTKGNLINYLFKIYSNTAQGRMDCKSQFGGFSYNPNN